MAKILSIPQFKNSTGTISVIEKKIKFKIKRVYFIYDIKGIRGGHKHGKKAKQFLICLKGKCDLIIIRNKKKKKIHLSNNKKRGNIGSVIGTEIRNTNIKTIIVVLALEFYDKKDYITKL